MKNILTILLLTLTVSCFGQTYPWMISKLPAQDADTANVLVMFPTGNANLTGRGRLISYETFAALIEPYISGGGTWGTITGTLSSQTDLQTALNAKAASGANTDITSIALDNTGLQVKNGTKKLIIQPTESQSANRTLSISVNDGDRTIDLEGDLHVTGAGIADIAGGSVISGTNTGDQDLSSYATNANLALKVNISDTASMLSPYLREQGYYWIDRHGAIANDGLNDRVAIQSLLDYVESIGGGVVVVPNGVFNVTYNAINEGLYIGDNTTLLGFGSGSEIRYTGHATNSSTAIQNRRSSGQYSDFQQRTGNENINIQGIKLSFTERDDFKNIGINLSGVTWGSIKDCWVDSCGGYSYLIGRTNDTDTIGNFSKNIILDNLKVTNMMDVGLEIWGAENVTARNLDISGRGVDTGYGNGIYVWNGAKNVHIYNAKIQKDTNDFDAVNRYMVAFAVGGIPYGDTITGAIKTQNVTFENVTSRTDQGFRINILNDVVPLHRVDSVYIRDCTFLGYDTVRNASDIRHCAHLVIEGCKFDRFARHLQFSTTSNTSQQNSVSDVTIRDNQFTWGEGIDFHGITDFNIYDNRFYYIFDQAPITVRGGRNGLIKNNYFLDIGNGTDQWCITLNKLTASVTRDTRLIEITGNTACDDRASKNTDDLITMYDATDSITVKFNVLDCADTDADQYLNIGTGTAIFTTELGLNDHDWYEEGTTRAPNAIGDNIFTEAPQVGMGTNAPATNLHVLGGGTVIARVESTAGQAQLSLKGTSLGQIENTTGHLYVTNAASGSDLILRTDGSTEKLRLSPTNATFADDVIVPAEAYAVGWNGSNEVPTKNDVYDQVQLKVNISDTATMLSHFVERADTATMLTPYILRSGRSGGQTVVGGTGTTDDLILQSTRGVGATGALIQMKVGNNGATVAQTILNNGLIGVGTVSPSNLSGAYFGGTQVNPLWVSSPSGLTGLVVQGTDGQAIQFINNTSNTATADFGYYAPDLWFVNRTNSGNVTFSAKTSGGSTVYPLMLYPSGKASMHSQSTDAALEVNLGTSNKFRLSYDDANGSAAVYNDETISSTGVVTNNAVGSSSSFVFTDPFANTATSLTLGAAATTFALTSNVMTITGNGGGNTLATITAGFSGQILTLIFADANVTITDDAGGTASTINLSAAFTSTANDVMTLVHNGTSWREVSRSVN